LAQDSGLSEIQQRISDTREYRTVAPFMQ